MFAWVDRKRALAAALALALVPTLAGARDYGLGRTPSEAEIAAWDIDIRPDGKGLPPGSGSVDAGETVYVEQCASCHGDFAEGRGRYPGLMGGQGSLASEDPVKTIGSYWPFASTVWDYVHRAMPFGNAQSLTDDETYALTAYLLYVNEIIDADQVMNQDTLARVTMPNEDGFHREHGPEFPRREPCMKDCRDEVDIIGRATDIGVTPEQDPPQDDAAETGAAAEQGGDAGDPLAGDPESGRQLFRQCAGCHTIDAGGSHRLGPNLHGVVGREAGGAEGFGRYSGAMKESDIVWNADSLKRYLADPQGFMPGTGMPFNGIQDEQALRDLIAYLRAGS